MDETRLRRLYGALADSGGDPFTHLTRICHASVDLLNTSGAGIMLMADRIHQGTIYATGDTIRALEDLQNGAAEGPCIDSYTLGRPVLESDLAGSGVRAWPLLAPGALKAGMRALFSFPLQVDDTSIGALNLYRDRAEELTLEEIDDARLLAAIAARDVLAMQADATPDSLPGRVADLSGDRVSIEQATGMIAAQLSLSIAEAGGRLRQLALEQERHIADVARDIVSRRLRLR